MQSSELHRITDWLIDGARSSGTPSEMIADVCEHLVAAGLPLWRFGIFIRTLHPEIFGRNFIWKQGAQVEIGTVDFEIQETPEFKASPLSALASLGRSSSPFRAGGTAQPLPLPVMPPGRALQAWCSQPLQRSRQTPEWVLFGTRWASQPI